jgi:hypothetical protein
MVNEWLKEGIALFNSVSFHWPDCKVKQFSDHQFHAIRQTAIHAWLPEIANKASLSSMAKRPSSNWISDWHTSPVYEKRYEWETYFCNTVLRAKNVAKALHKQERLHPMEVLEEEPAAKKAKTTTDGSSSDYEQSNLNPIDFLTLEINKLHQELNHLKDLQNNNQMELLKEMDGYMKKFGSQLFFLHYGQHNIQQTLDRAMESTEGKMEAGK